jgi:hypothetical protein
VNWQVRSSGTGRDAAPDRRPREALVPNPKGSLREQVREVMRFHHYALRTERAYWHWMVRFLRHFRRPGESGPSGWRHPKTLGAAEVAGFLSHLATDRKVAAATQNQALNALVFVYAEVTALFEAADPEMRLPLQLLYRNGLRVERRWLSVTDQEVPSDLRRPVSIRLWCSAAA